MSITVSQAAKAAIMKSGIFSDHPAPPATSLYFDSVTFRKNLNTGMMECVMTRGAEEVVVMSTSVTVDFDAGDTATFGKFAGYMPVNITA